MEAKEAKTSLEKARTVARALAWPKVQRTGEARARTWKCGSQICLVS
jgi:hypothetical protein